MKIVCNYKDNLRLRLLYAEHCVVKYITLDTSSYSEAVAVALAAEE